MSEQNKYTILDKYTASLGSTNLKVDVLSHNADAIIAIAMADKSGIGSLLWRVKYNNDLTVYPALLEAWIRIIKNKAAREDWKMKTKAKEIARLSLQYFLNDVCEPCKATAKAPHPPNAQVLSDAPCATCRGTAKRPISGFKSQIDQIGSCVDMLETEEKMLGGRAMDKLRREF
mgnify:FL=1